MRPVAVLRPEPGNAATCARAAARGWSTVSLPLFSVRPLDWTPPATSGFDALLLTSANTLRHGGAGLAAMTALPVVAVGEATASAARAAGFTVLHTGAADAGEAIAAGERQGVRRWLHLGGRENRLPAGLMSIPVYASEATIVDAAPVAGTVALLHSPRAAGRMQELVALDHRATIRLVAISEATRGAAGAGWQATAVAARPTDAALLDAAAPLLD